MSSRRLEDLHPLMRPLVDAFLAACARDDIDILVTCTYRSDDEQARLYAQSRTKPGPRLTNAPPGRSMHNFRVGGKPASLAVDIVPMVSGKPVWSASAPVWQKVGKLGEEAGLEWAGRWKRGREYPHFQHPRAKSVRLSVN
jgi:peptidoglycan L-alanyl-D-glutamate endopeptidase CwlK